MQAPTAANGFVMQSAFIIEGQGWCGRWDSNPHGDKPQQILSVCLPFQHARTKRFGANRVGPPSSLAASRAVNNMLCCALGYEFALGPLEFQTRRAQGQTKRGAQVLFSPPLLRRGN